MSPNETKMRLFNAWTDLDTLIDSLFQEGTAAHAAGLRVKQAELEALANAVNQARKQVMLAFIVANAYADNANQGETK